MWPLILTIAFFAVLIIVAGFIWFWWAAPRDQVPPHLGPDDLRRLEVQDRLRQTSYQLLTAFALGATFLTTLFQFGINSQQWRADFELKTAQERLSQFTEATKAIAGTDGRSHVAGITTLQLLAVQDPKRFHQQASEVLTQFIADAQASNKMMESWQCDASEQAEQDAKRKNEIIIDEPNDPTRALVVAMKAVGHPQFASNRLNYHADVCQPQKQTIDHGPIWLEHMRLNQLDLSERDLSCAKMSQAHFHRVSFYGADLRGADMRGVRAADVETPSFPVDTIGKRLYKNASEGGIAEWKRHRCYITDFRAAKLQATNFEGAHLSGADLREADLTGANLCFTDIARANFQGAKGLTPDMLQDACIEQANFIGDLDKAASDAQPIGLESLGPSFRVRLCSEARICSAYR